MLNKRTLFSGVYALALFGAITSCIGILNELLNLVQLYDKGITNLLVNYYEKEDFLIPFVYHLVAFVLCFFTVMVLIMYVTNILKEKHVWIPNVCIIITCVTVFALSWTLIYQVQQLNYKGDHYYVGSFDYTTLYAFRSVVLSYIASTVTILFCNIIQCRSKKRALQNHTDEETQE